MGKLAANSHDVKVGEHAPGADGEKEKGQKDPLQEGVALS